MSLANNRDLRVAALNVEAARAQYRIQRSNLMPSVGLAGKETAQRTPGSLTPSGEATTSHNYRWAPRCRPGSWTCSAASAA